MKILAIRGRNLASLAEPFALDFREPPLRDAGVFAICGPTGAGKSTLLDALCLALYDDTPRLTAAGVRGGLPDTADVTLSPKDTAHLLRRGAAEGEAIVEFLGNDGIEYRARWGIRRARGRADGKLQKVEMSLVRCDDDVPIGHLKTEVLDAIKARIGLDFGQFTRAVLLAQNEFAAFLKAGDDERAALLQTLTGTDTFERISKAVFLRSREETQQREDLERQRALYPLLSTDERARLDASVAELRQRQGALQAQALLLEAGARWHSAERALRADHAAAEAAVATARAAQEAAAPRRLDLARTDAGRGARAVIEAQGRATTELDDAARAADAAAVTALAAGSAHATAVTAAQQAQTLYAAAYAAYADAQPALASARTLDVQLADRQTARQRTTDGLETARRVDEHAATAHDALLSELLRAQQRRDAAREWLDIHARLQPLAEHWERWGAELARAAALADEVATAAAHAAHAATALATVRTECEQAEHRCTRAETNAADAAHTDDAAHAAMAALDGAAITRAREAAEARRALLGQADAALRELDSTRTRLDEVVGERASAAADVTHWDAALLHIRALIPPADAAARQAAQALRRAELAAAADVERLRDALEPHEPCPVCGSREHPWRAESPAFDALLHELGEDARSCAQTLDRLRGEEVTASVRAQDASARVAAAAASFPTAVAALDRASHAWTALALAGEVAASGMSIARRWLDEAQVNNRAAHAACTAAAAALEAARQRAGDTAQARRAAEDARGLERTHFERAQADVGRLDAEHRAMLTVHAAAHARLAQQLDSLDEALVPLQDEQQPSWRGAWSQDAAAAHARWRALAVRWRAQQQDQTSAHGDARSLEGRVTGAREVLEQARSAVEHASKAAGDAAQEHERVSTARAAQFGGRAAAEVEAELNGAVDDAAASRLTADNARSKALQDSTAAITSRAAAEQRVARARDSATAAAQDIRDWQARWPLADVDVPDIDTLRALLQLDDGALARERDALARIDAELRDATVLRDERGRQHAVQLAARLDARDDAAIAQELASVSAALEALGGTLAGQQLQQQKDDEHARNGRELSAHIEAQAAVSHTWAQLSELVGSANGQKFRNFAQQLTLDVLLAHANAHLHTLARRYRLERGEDSLSLRVVDQDMADERRLVHSLSGGESFLVSLGLALGLASLSSHRVQVESLFIDEGFGSLDADTLRVAMDALDVLQAQGRKVGVISHVPEMTERIGTRVEVKKQSGGRSVVTVA